MTFWLFRGCFVSFNRSLCGLYSVFRPFFQRSWGYCSWWVCLFRYVPGVITLATLLLQPQDWSSRASGGTAKSWPTPAKGSPKATYEDCLGAAASRDPPEASPTRCATPWRTFWGHSFRELQPSSTGRSRPEKRRSRQMSSRPSRPTVRNLVFYLSEHLSRS